MYCKWHREFFSVTCLYVCLFYLYDLRECLGKQQTLTRVEFNVFVKKQYLTRLDDVKLFTLKTWSSHALHQLRRAFGYLANIPCESLRELIKLIISILTCNNQSNITIKNLCSQVYPWGVKLKFELITSLTHSTK